MLHKIRQAGAELGQAQHKLGLPFILIFCRLGFYRFGFVELVGRISLVGLIEMIWFSRLGLVTLFNRFGVGGGKNDKT